MGVKDRQKRGKERKKADKRKKGEGLKVATGTATLKHGHFPPALFLHPCLPPLPPIYFFPLLPSSSNLSFALFIPFSPLLPRSPFFSHCLSLPFSHPSPRSLSPPFLSLLISPPPFLSLLPHFLFPSFLSCPSSSPPSLPPPFFPRHRPPP